MGWSKLYEAEYIENSVLKSQMKLYYLGAARRYTHGCTDAAVYRDNGDGTATCIEVENCQSCWQVGHYRGHVYAELGEVVPVETLLATEDLVLP